jgi:hypothetical protein
MPALLVIAAWGLALLENDLTRRLSSGASYILTAGVVLVNLSFFLMAPPYLFGIRRIAFTTPSHPTIRYRDEYLSERIEYIEESFPPSSTAVWVTGADYRHPDYYLRDYTSLWYVEGISPWADLPSEIQRLVVFSEGLNIVAATYNEAEATALPGGELIYTLTAPRYGRSSLVGSVWE